MDIRRMTARTSGGQDIENDAKIAEVCKKEKA
jgi:hypothetical protein